MKKLSRVLLVCLALIGSASSSLGELPPPPAESRPQPSPKVVAASSTSALLSGASHVARSATVPTSPTLETRKLAWDKFERKLAVLYPNSKVYLISQGFKCVVRGQAKDSEEAAHILNVVHEEMVNQIEASAEHLAYLNRSFGLSGDGRAFKLREWARGLIINELHIPGSKQDDGVTHHEVGVGWLEAITASPSPRWLPPLHHNFMSGDIQRAMPGGIHPDAPVPPPPGPVDFLEVSPQIASLLSVPPTALKCDSRAASPDAVDPFQSHLRASEQHLRRVGLTDAAEQLQSLHRKFETQHMEALFVVPAQARFELKSRESAIAGPKQGTRVHESQISLQVRLIELADTSKTHESLTTLFGVPITKTAIREGAGSAGGLFETNEIQPLIEFLCKTGQAKVISEPKVTVLSGRECRFLSGGELAVPPGNSSNHSREVSYIPFGTSIHACPTVNGDLISLTVQAAHTRQEDAVKQVSHPGFSSRRLTTTVELRPGQTLVLAGLKTPQSRPTPTSQTEGKVTVVGSFVDDLAKSNSDDADLLIVITPEIVTPIEPREVPPVPGFEVTRPTELPPAPVPSRE